VLNLLGGDVRVPVEDKEARHLLGQNFYGRHLLLPRDAPAPAGLWAPTFARVAADKDHEVMYALVRSKLVSLLHPALDPPGETGGRSPFGGSGGSGGKRRRIGEAATP
jgi:hypothetical protein